MGTPIIKLIPRTDPYKELHELLHPKIDEKEIRRDRIETIFYRITVTILIGITIVLLIVLVLLVIPLLKQRLIESSFLDIWLFPWLT